MTKPPPLPPPHDHQKHQISPPLQHPSPHSCCHATTHQKQHEKTPNVASTQQLVKLVSSRSKITNKHTKPPKICCLLISSTSSPRKVVTEVKSVQIGEKQGRKRTGNRKNIRTKTRLRWE